jgi:F-type H+-transporting ATPase subunit b
MRRRLLAGVAIGVLALVGPAGHAFAQEAEGGEEHELSHEAEECLEILEDGGEPDDCQEAPSPIFPATDEMIWGAISFALLFFLLAKFAYPALKKAMDDRADKIRGDLDEAERARTESETVLADYQRQLQDARNEAARIIEEARQQADTVRRDLTARAEAEANELRQRNAEQVGAERDRVLAEMRGQVATLAIELAEKVVESNLDRETNMRLIENYISSVGTRS